MIYKRHWRECVCDLSVLRAHHVFFVGEVPQIQLITKICLFDNKTYGHRRLFKTESAGFIVPNSFCSFLPTLSELLRKDIYMYNIWHLIVVTLHFCNPSQYWVYKQSAVNIYYLLLDLVQQNTEYMSPRPLLWFWKYYNLIWW